jgi:cobyric acid synthase
LRGAWLDSLRTGVTAATSWTAHIDGELDRLADAVEAALDMAAVDRLLSGA